MDEISDISEKCPPTVKLTLLQTVVRSINDLRIIETLDEFQSTTHVHGSSTSLSYQTYYDLLIDACVRYDKTKKANIGKRRNVYNSLVELAYIDYPQDASDFVLQSPLGGIDLLSDEFYQIHMLSSRHPPPTRPGHPLKPPFRAQSQQSGSQTFFKKYDGPIYIPPQIYKLLSQDAMKSLKAYNTEALDRFHKRKVHNTYAVEEPQDDPPEPSMPDSGLSELPESDLDIPEDPILDFVSSQCHRSEDLDQALQAYLVYHVPSSQDSSPSHERMINHHYTSHVAQASPAKNMALW